MLLVLAILGLLLFSVRTALIVAVTIPFSLLFAFICLDLDKIPPISCPSAPSISASSSTALLSWWKTFFASYHCAANKVTA